MWAWLSDRSEGGKQKLSAQIHTVEQRLDDLETRFRSLKMEWEDVYDKLHKAAQRLNARTRRDKRDEEPPAAEQPVEAGAGPAPVHGLGSHDQLEAARNRRAR